MNVVRPMPPVMSISSSWPNSSIVAVAVVLILMSGHDVHTEAGVYITAQRSGYVDADTLSTCAYTQTYAVGNSENTLLLVLLCVGLQRACQHDDCDDKRIKDCLGFHCFCSLCLICENVNIYQRLLNCAAKLVQISCINKNLGIKLLSDRQLLRFS